MKKTDKVLKIVATVLFTLAAALFFYLKYPNHLRFLEMSQLFEFSWSYFTDVCSVPGGLADYIGRFLTQFFIHPAAGALITTLLLLLLQRSVWAVMHSRSSYAFILSFIPMMLAWTFLCNENALPGALVSLIVSLASAKAVLSIKKRGIRIASSLIASALLYWICGPIAIAFIVPALRQEKPYLGITAAAVMILFAIISEQFCQVTLQRLFTGVHYIKFRNVFPLWIWLSAAASVLLVFIPDKWKEINLATGFCIAILFGFFRLPFYQADNGRERTMKFAALAVDERWDEIIAEADRSAPKTYTAIRCLNLALGKKGLLPEKMFSYVQEGPECLVSDVTMDFVSDMVTAQVYWQLALVGTAQHFAFEAQENLPDFQKSSACYRMLARTASVNGQAELAGRYLKALGRTLFHRNWASQFTETSELEQKRSFQINESSYFFIYEKIASTLGLLYTQHPDNSLALDYLLACNLLNKDLDSFTAYLPMARYENLPKNWQEAFMLDWLILNGTTDDMPYGISKDSTSRLEAFMQGYLNNARTDSMLKKYSDTYWFYHFYRGNNE